MSGSRPIGWWASLVDSLGRGTRRAETALLDTALMVALADGPLTLAQRDAVARMVDNPKRPLAPDWSRVQQRIESIAADGPLFAATRQQIADSVNGRRTADEAMKTAARVAMVDGPLGQSARAMFASVAQDLGVKDPERFLETMSEDERQALRYLRTPFNDPEDPRPETIYEAIAEAENDAALRLVVFKLTAIRTLLECRFESESSRSIVELGTIHPTHHGRLRIDAELAVGEAQVFVRVLGPGEALYPAEAGALEELASGLSTRDQVMITHAGPLSAADRIVGQTTSAPQRVDRYPLPDPSE